MSVIITLEAEIQTGKKESLLTMLKKYLPETKAYEGFIDITINTQKGSNHVLFYEKWETVEAYEAYLSWRTETGVMDELSAIFKDRPSIRYYETEDL